MSTSFEVQITIERLPLSPRHTNALLRLSRYDHIVCTSKNAYTCFLEALHELSITPPEADRIIRVGPRADILNYPLSGKRILFPRSTLAPFDIVTAMRAQGAIVTVLPLYTVHGVPLSQEDRSALCEGRIPELYFKSPSGITGLLAQLRPHERAQVRNIPVLAIGDTTAEAARAAGFTQVRIKNV